MISQHPFRRRFGAEAVKSVIGVVYGAVLSRGGEVLAGGKLSLWSGPVVRERVRALRF